ncbi:MAG TPA: hypothetical protein VF161_12670 [Steroidobacteraceae bacterium]
MDIRITNHGSIVILHAISEAAREWLDANLADDVQTWGPTGYVVEPRYVDPIIEGAIADGLEIS